MKLPKWTIVAIGLLMMMVLGACGSKYGSPEAAAETYFNALEARDKDRVEEAVCEELQDQIPDFEDNEDVDIEFEFDVRFNVDKEEDDTATVDVYGTIRQRTITEEADSESKVHSRDDNPLFSITLTKDGDDWKVCDQVAIGLGQ